MIYENGVLKQILVDGGYIAFSGPAHYYYYYLKDHLGNNRVVVSPSGTPLQVNHYYPFGGLFGESTGNSLQRFRFNGKEFDRTHGLDWYDYGARHMTPDVGRFTTIDPMAEKYYNISPYAYCANNPVKYIDLRGDSLTLIGEQNDINKTTDIYNKGLGGYYTVSSDKHGLLSLNSVNGKDVSCMNDTQKNYYNMLANVINGNGMATIKVEYGSEVLIGDINNYKIDISDIMNIGDGSYISSISVLGHETLEEYLVQTSTSNRSKSDIINSAHLKASGFERLITGSYLDPINRVSINGKMSIPVIGEDRIITIHLNNNNVKYVTR